jgi:hypothetical protein
MVMKKTKEPLALKRKRSGSLLSPSSESVYSDNINDKTAGYIKGEDPYSG